MLETLSCCPTPIAPAACHRSMRAARQRAAGAAWGSTSAGRGVHAAADADTVRVTGRECARRLRCTDVRSTRSRCGPTTVVAIRIRALPSASVRGRASVTHRDPARRCTTSRTPRAPGRSRIAKVAGSPTGTAAGATRALSVTFGGLCGRAPTVVAPDAIIPPASNPTITSRTAPHRCTESEYRRRASPVSALDRSRPALRYGARAADSAGRTVHDDRSTGSRTA